MEELNIRGMLDCESLVLDYMGIRSLDAHLQDLAVLPILHSLDLHGNDLTELPSDMSCLRHLRTLHLEDNPFKSIQAMIPGLQSLPLLRDLNISLQNTSQEESIISALPQLQTLNGTTLAIKGRVSPTHQAERHTQNDAHSVSLTQHDLESVAILYGAAKALRSQLTHEEDRQMTAFFEDHVKRVMEALEVKLSTTTDPFMRKAALLMAKHDLYDACFHEVVGHAQISSPEFGAVLRKLRAVHRDLFHEFPGVLSEVKPHFLQRLSDVHSELVRSEKESAMLLDAAEVLEKEATAHVEDKLRMEAHADVARRKLTEENARLRARGEELEQELQTLRRTQQLQNQQQGTNSTLSAKSSPDGRNSISNKQENTQARSNSTSAAALRINTSTGIGGGDRKGPDGNLTSNQKGTSPRLSNGVRSNDMLRLKQLLDVIQQLYASKVRFDDKCRTGHLARVTMENHMYTFLDQRYGLKKLIMEHASAILKATHKYSRECNDVKVFGRILRNEIDEEFRFVQERLKDTVNALVKEGIRARHPLKTDAVIESTWRTKTGEGPLAVLKKEEWLPIVRAMYNRTDAEALMLSITSHVLARMRSKQKEKMKHTNGLLESETGSVARRKRPVVGGGGSATAREGSRKMAAAARSPRRVLREEAAAGIAAEERGGVGSAASAGPVPYNELLELMLEFQLASHERFVAPFRASFIKVDADVDGVLDEAEMRSLVHIVAPKKTVYEVDDLLDQVDPWNHQQITFSEAVKGLSSELFKYIETQPQQEETPEGGDGSVIN